MNNIWIDGYLAPCVGMGPVVGAVWGVCMILTMECIVATQMIFNFKNIFNMNYDLTSRL